MLVTLDSGPNSFGWVEDSSMRYYGVFKVKVIHSSLLRNGKLKGLYILFSAKTMLDVSCLQQYNSREVFNGFLLSLDFDV